jgi:DNA-binding transcriptional MerR regulator
MRLKKTYSSREVAALTGLTGRQLQLWDAGGLLSPAIPSHRTAAGGYTERRYSPIELFELLALADLRQRGFSVVQLHTIVDALRLQFHSGLFAATGGGGPVQLLTDGQEVYARSAAGDLYSLLKDPGQPLLMMGNEGLEELTASPRRRRRQRRRPRSRNAAV